MEFYQYKPSKNIIYRCFWPQNGLVAPQKLPRTAQQPGDVANSRYLPTWTQNGGLMNSVYFATLNESRVFSGSTGTFPASFINTNPGIMLVNEISGLKTCILLVRFARRSHNDRQRSRTSRIGPWSQHEVWDCVDFR